ncbi:MAG: hypothetical protein ACTS5I_04710, partial [Rhodanobacter sp.]
YTLVARRIGFGEVRIPDVRVAAGTTRDITLTAVEKVTINAGTSIHIEAKGEVSVAGLNVSCEAQVGFSGKGSASAELSAAGQTTVKGAMVMIN